MSFPKSRAARSKRTKDQLIDELEAIESKYTNATAVDPVAASLARENAAKVRTAAQTLSVDSIVNKGGAFSLEVQRTVAQLVEQATQKAEELRTLEAAIEVEREELERLYDLDVASASVQALIEEHNARKTALEKEIALARQTWQEEASAHAKVVAQRNAETEAIRRRDQQEYDYRVGLERQRAKEQFDYNLAQAERAHKEALAAEEKALAARRAEIDAAATELNQFKARVERFDAEVDAASKTAVAVATNSLKKELTNQHLLERKDLETSLALERQKTMAMAESQAKMAAEIEKLHSQLDAAKRQVTEITVKALESASGQQALQSVREMVKENGTTSRSTKGA